MEVNTYNIKKQVLAKYPRFGEELASVNMVFSDYLPISTAATDGKNIYVKISFFEGLKDKHKKFVIAHEILHIKFKHMYRLKAKNGKKRDMDIWNYACDAIINANLERDGFEIPEGCVNIPNALNYSAEELYEILLEEKCKKLEQNTAQSTKPQGQQGKSEKKITEEEQNKEENKEQESNDQNSDENEQKEPVNENSEKQSNGQDIQGENSEQGNKDDEEQKSEGLKSETNDSSQNENNSLEGDHSLWEKAFEELQNPRKENIDNNNQGEEQENDLIQNENVSNEIDESKEFEQNREYKRQKFQSIINNFKNIMLENEEKVPINYIGESKHEMDWKTLVSKKVEKSELIWSQRRSIADNNWAWRLIEDEVEDDAITEIMIDISGSVDLDLIKAFLRQIKPLLKESRIKVGCFNEKFWGFVEIKDKKDIDNFELPKGSRNMNFCGTNLDIAARSFSKDNDINRFVFTDGRPSIGYMPKDDLKKVDMTWIVYGNKNFEPCCGDVIQITEKQLERLKSYSDRER